MDKNRTGQVPAFANRYRNLADPQLGGAVIMVSDEFFAPAKRMLSAEEPQFEADRFDDHGKWMDGWESRRRRDGGHDYCVVRICPGVIHGVDIDTRHFTGNFPPAASILACRVDGDPGRDCNWQELIPRTELQGNRHHFLEVDDSRTWTHLMLRIFPDGGIARFRVFGEANAEPDLGEEWIDLAASAAGGCAIACNDMHFGHMSNLIKPGPSVNMGDGWETRRRRTEGNDWVILGLGRAGTIYRIEVDTAHFRGNYPASCSLRGATTESDDFPLDASASWAEILPPAMLGPDQLHVFEREVRNVGPVSHVRLDIYPDGGIARLRLHGRPEGD